MIKSISSHQAKTVLFLILLAGFLRGGHPSMVGKLPIGVRLTDLGFMETQGPMAVDATGMHLAYTDHGLKIREIDSGSIRTMTSENPTKVAWSQDGNLLAMACEVEGGDGIRLLTTRGEDRGRTTVPGRVCEMQWCKDGTVLILALELENMRFGTRMSQVLHRWNGKGAPTQKVLNESTLMPGAVNLLRDLLPHILGFQISPLQDEVLYYRLYNPPALDHRLRLMLYNLESGRSRALSTVTLDASGACFSGQGDRVLFGDGEKESHLLDPWGGRTFSTFPVPGKRVAMSPSGRTMILDGHLIHNGKMLVTFPGQVQGLFPRSGGSLFLVWDSHLYRLKGLPEDDVTPIDESERDGLRKLRKWLSEGLISPEDYRMKWGLVPK